MSCMLYFLNVYESHTKQFTIQNINSPNESLYRDSTTIVTTNILYDLAFY